MALSLRGSRRLEEDVAVVVTAGVVSGLLDAAVCSSQVSRNKIISPPPAAPHPPPSPTCWSSPPPPVAVASDLAGVEVDLCKLHSIPVSLGQIWPLGCFTASFPPWTKSSSPASPTPPPRLSNF
jgi:hypothetical protein